MPKKDCNISEVSGMGGLDFGESVLDGYLFLVDEGERQPVRRNGQQGQFLQRKYNDLKRVCEALKKENVCLYERLAQAEKWKVMYDRLWDFLLRAYPFDVGMRKELLKVAAAVDDKEREQQLRDSLKEDLRPQGMVVGNMYGGVVGDTVNGLPFR